MPRCVNQMRVNAAKKSLQKLREQMSQTVGHDKRARLNEMIEKQRGIIIKYEGEIK